MNVHSSYRFHNLVFVQAGWGRNEKGESFGALREAEIDLKHNDDCLVEFNDLVIIASKLSFCGGIPEQRISACDGDSGL